MLLCVKIKGVISLTKSFIRPAVTAIKKIVKWLNVRRRKNLTGVIKKMLEIVVDTSYQTRLNKLLSV